MLKIVRDLFRYNREFAVGARPDGGRSSALAALSAFSPYPPIDIYVVPPDVPPSWAYPFGHHLARPGRVLAAHLRHPQHAALRLRRRAPQPRALAR